MNTSDIFSLSRQNVTKDVELRKELLQKIPDCIIYREGWNGKRLFELLWPLYEQDSFLKGSHDWYIYHQLLLLRFQHLNFFIEEEIPAFFKQDVVMAITDERIDLRSRVVAKLIQLDYRKQVNFKENILKVVEEKNEDMFESFDEKTVTGVPDIIKAYRGAYGLDIIDGFDQANFILEKTREQKLTVKGVEELRQFLKFYEWLKLHPLSAEGFEEIIMVDESKGLVVDHGVLVSLFEDSSPKARTVAPSPAVIPVPKAVPSPILSVSAIQPSSIDKKKVLPIVIDPDEASRIEAALATMRTMPTDPVSAMLKALHAKKLIEVQGYLRYFALSGDLPDLMVHPEIMKAFKPYLERKLGQAAALGYTSKPKRPQYVKLFLQWVLQEELSLSPEAASARMQPIIQILAVDDQEFASAQS